MIHAIYILVEGGICVYSRVYDSDLADPYLMSSFISAVSSFSREAIGDELRGIESNGRFIFVADHDQITTVVIADDPNEIGQTLIDYIGLNFLSRFGSILVSGELEVATFKSFDEVLEKMIPPQISTGAIIDPSEPLDALSIIELPPKLKDTALLLVRERRLTPWQVARELSISEEEATEHLEGLVRLGKAGRKKVGEHPLYFV